MGTNDVFAAQSRASLRQAKSCVGTSPYHRATADTDSAPLKLSSTI